MLLRSVGLVSSMTQQPLLMLSSSCDTVLVRKTTKYHVHCMYMYMTYANVITFLTVLAACPSRVLPTAVEPVKVTFLT
jgi:hypothetical protein